MRIMIKGGVWKNSEDEILKAAVMKYGLNNWSRVASLMVRKSAKQCKARWYEWLDPAIKKTEWTRDEEEKLLHLAKLFPCQWRTIAPIVGRTPYQCLEQYEKLLDQAQGKEERDENDPRRLKPGEIDPAPETKPARPDALDIDDDEREMLAEARARLANTRGKKAKRKAREKQLEEARRLASLQKRRELKAAGIAVSRNFKRRKGLDLANEVPFEQPVPLGYHPVGPEETPEGNLSLANISLQQLEGNWRDAEEARHRKDDERKMKRLKKDNLIDVMEKIDTVNDPHKFQKRTKLQLPQPQLNDEDLHAIVKMGSEGFSSRAGLLDTPANMTPQQTPAVLFSGTTPQQSSVRGDVTSTTPRSTGGMSYTPQIGTSNVPNFETRAAALKIRSALDTLPAPQNEIEIQMPELPPEKPEDDDMMEEDLTDVLLRQQQEEEAILAIEWEKNTKVIKQKLQRPLMLNTIIIEKNNEIKNNEIIEKDNILAEEMLNEEIMNLVTVDAARFPIKGAKVPSRVPERHDIPSNLIKEAENMICNEEIKIKNYQNHNIDNINNIWEDAINSYILITNPKPKFDIISKASKSDRIDSAKALIEVLKKVMNKLKKRGDKMEEKIQIQTLGLQRRCRASVKSVSDLIAEKEKLSVDINVFKVLSIQEENAILNRRQEQTDLLRDVKCRNGILQSKYKRLHDEIYQLNKILEGDAMQL
eukprot:GHVL01015985.1.p1 GENE.GHVL01015985.1~~GHVL01015985.1.p1  ORF type:complete len:704 (+),score=200.99 GHVL01015985.1:166-2277(+)